MSHWRLVSRGDLPRLVLDRVGPRLGFSPVSASMDAQMALRAENAPKDDSFVVVVDERKLHGADYVRSGSFLHVHGPVEWSHVKLVVSYEEWTRARRA